ncbi:MAG: hypothetical protein ACE5G8_17890, partial [Anaerolineae bacterium]
MTQSYGFRRWYLGLGLFCIFWLLALLLAQLNAPADGFSDLDGLTRGPVTAMEQLTRAQTGLQPGDEVLAINGLPVAELRQRAFTFAKPPVPLQIGVPARYTVLRQGRRLDIWVTPVRLSLAELLLKRRFNLLSGAIFWLIGLAVFWRKPRERAAQIFYLASLGLSMSMLSRGLFALQPADLANQTPFLIFSSIEFVTFWLNFPLILHIFLIFPRKSPLLTKAPWLIPLAYPTLAVLSLALGFAQGANLSTALARMDQIRFPIAMVYVIVGVGNQFYAFFTTRTRTERNQLRWIVWGIGVGGTPWLFFFALPQALFGQAWVSVDVFSLFLSIVPISFGFSIVKYRLFDIDTLIHRSLVYGLVSLMLGGVYLLLVALLARLLPLLGLDATSPALTVVVVIVVAAIFTPARERLQRVIDRAFFQDRLAFEQLPLQVSRELSGAVQLPAIITLLTRTIPQRLQITAAELSVFDLRRKRWVSYRGTEEQPSTVPVTAEL